MDIRKFLLTSEGKLVITNVGDYTKDPTHDEASRAPGLTISNIYGPSSRDSRYGTAVHTLQQFIENATCVERRTLSFPSDTDHMFELKCNILSAAPSYKIWKAELNDDGILLSFIDVAHVPKDCPPNTVGQALIRTPYINFDITVDGYGNYPGMRYCCFMMTDESYPEIKQRKLQAYTVQLSEENVPIYTQCGSIDFYKNLQNESVLNISSK